MHKLLVLAVLAAAPAFAADPAAIATSHRPPRRSWSRRKPDDWRRPDPANTLYLELPAGRVVIELSPRFAPAHVAQHQGAGAREILRRSAGGARAGQLRRAVGRSPTRASPTEDRARKLPDETVRRLATRSCRSSNYPTRTATRRRPAGSTAFPVGIEREPSGQVWMTHCYGALGVGRDNWPDNGSGAELYVVIGQAPRQLDRNIVRGRHACCVASNCCPRCRAAAARSGCTRSRSSAR